MNYFLNPAYFTFFPSISSIGIWNYCYSQMHYKLWPTRPYWLPLSEADFIGLSEPLKDQKRAEADEDAGEAQAPPPPDMELDSDDEGGMGGEEEEEESLSSGVQVSTSSTSV